jgi:hypothetical protein
MLLNYRSSLPTNYKSAPLMACDELYLDRAGGLDMLTITLPGLFLAPIHREHWSGEVCQNYP